MDFLIFQTSKIKFPKMGLGLIGVKDAWEDFKTPNFWRDCMIDYYVTFMLLFINLILGPSDRLSVALIMGEYLFNISTIYLN